MRSASLILSVVALLLASPVVWAHPHHHHASSEEAMKLAKERAGEYMKAFDRGDAAALAGLYTADADRVLLGERRLTGREEIEKDYREFFAHSPDAKLQITVEHARLVRPDVLLIEGPWAIRGAAEGVPTAGLSTVIAVKEKDRWRLTYVLTYAAEGDARR